MASKILPFRALPWPGNPSRRAALAWTELAARDFGGLATPQALRAPPLECVINEELQEEWEKYLTQTEKHVEILTRTCATLGLDPGEMTPGCQIVHENGKALVKAMKMALAAANPAAAQLVACECVVLAETKDHADWELIGACAKGFDGEEAAALREAYEEVEDEEDEHLYHTKGWCRELWLQSLGLEAVLPPPEERKDVKTAIEAAQAKQQAHPSA